MATEHKFEKNENHQEQQKCQKSDNNQTRICCEYQSGIIKDIKQCEPSMIDDICWLISEYIVSAPFGDKVDENPYFNQVQNDNYNFKRALSFAWKSCNWVVNEEAKFKLLPKEPKLGHVSDIYFAEKGENNELPWILIGKYNDFYFCMRAGCDYRGWDYNGNYGDIRFASHWCNLSLFGLTDFIRWKWSAGIDGCKRFDTKWKIIQ